ncbi:MAG: MG2 domain-containing protein [Thermodesulfovibrionales bacterium]|nr:MG2 domain-containing protein [Thermodesulfovibrionales bacterium]
MRVLLKYATFVMVLLLPLSIYGFDIQSFEPSGTVKAVEQVVVRFTSQMVALGDISVSEPFDIDCPIKGKPHWLDTKTWAYDFEEALPSGIVCTFRLKDSFRDISGNHAKGKRIFSFNTGGPSILEVSPHEGADNIDEKQVFLIRLDGKVRKDSVLKKAYCLVSGINERIGVSIISDKEFDNLWKALNPKPFEKDDYVFAIRCNRTFPNKADVKIVWQKGMESPSGISTTQDQILSFKTRDTFRVRFSCQRESPQSQCIPLLPMQIRFSSPVKIKDAERITLKTPEGRVIKPTFHQYDFEEGYTYVAIFKGPFREKTEYTIDIPKDLKDDSGRVVSNISQFPLKVKTDVYPPIAKFPSRFGIIESKDSPAIPLTVRNIEEQISLGMVDIKPSDIGDLKGSVYKVDERSEKEIIQWLMKVASASRSSSILRGVKSTKNITVPKPHKKTDFEVIGIPIQDSGFYVVEIQSRLLGKSLLGADKPMYVQTAQLVTNLAVHFKRGSESSLVWVTNLDSAKPSSETLISIRDCKGNLIHSGKTDKDGILMIKKSLPSDDKLPTCELKQADDSYFDYPQLIPVNNISRGLFVFAKKDKDISFVHTSWDRGIEPYRYNLRLGSQIGNIKAHTILDRPIYRAGETVHMSHLIRSLTVEGFDYPKKGELPDTLIITHIGSEQSYSMPLRWDSRYNSQNDWKIPKDAKLGMYQIQMQRKDKSVFSSGIFRVEEFKVPLMRATIKPVQETLVAPKEIDIDVGLNYLSGGGAKNEFARFRYALSPLRVSFPDYDEYEIARGGVKVGVQRRGMDIDDETDDIKLKDVTTTDIALDDKGCRRISLKNIMPIKSAMQLKTELEYKDPNGETNTTSYNIPLYPSSILLGILPEHWTAREENVKVEVVALDTKGRTLEGIPITVEIFKKRFYSHRKRLIGGFYSYEHLLETKRVAEVCKGVSDKRGVFVCEFAPKMSGNIVIQAATIDNYGNASITQADVWVSGKDEQWFDVSDSDRIDIIPEKRQYDVGQEATIQVRMPFRRATALVSVEREGIIDAFVTEISGKDPVITLPIKPNYAPNVFVSALVVRGRVGDVKPTAVIDLGKPAFKLGITEIKVGWRDNEIDVKVTTDKDTYRIREKVKARVELAPKNKQTRLQREKTTVAVAVIDEGLLEITKNRSWDILQAMMELRGYDVHTYTGQLQVVGKRHFGLKALPQGGGGGMQVTRELFDTLIYWNPNLQLDEQGRGEFTFELNDSITSFRIAVVAHSGKSLFGSGFKSIKSWQEIMLFSGLPRIVRETDTYDAVFTLRNVSASDTQIDVTAHFGEKSLHSKTLNIKAGESQEVSWQVDVPKGADSQHWMIVAKDVKTGFTDSLKVKQAIYPLWLERVIHSEFMQLNAPTGLKIQGGTSPSDKLDVYFSKSITKGLNVVKEYMHQYPYTCLEQLVSRAVVLNNKEQWAQIVASLPTYMDSHGLLKYFPSMIEGSDTLTSYVISISHEAGLEIPEGIKQRMLDGLTNFINGKGIGYSPLKTADYMIRKVTAMSALSRFRKVDNQMFSIINMDVALMPTSTLIDYIYLVRHVDNLKDRQQMLSDAIKNLISRLNIQGSVAVFNNERADRLVWLMVTPDTNMARTILTLVDDDGYKDVVRNLLLGFIKRSSKGIWDTTTANAWGSIALNRFASRHEGVGISGKTTTSLNGQTRSVLWNERQDEYSISYTTPSRVSTLNIQHEGTGSPWVMLTIKTSKPPKDAVFSGYEIKKEIEKTKTAGLNVGDIVKVKIQIDAKADMTWVVLRDPIPAGAVITRIGLNSEVSDVRQNIVPVFEEKASDSYRVYFDYIPKGRWQVEYLMRLNTSGRFNLPPTRIEALYSPDVFGELPNERIVIKRSD